MQFIVLGYAVLCAVLVMVRTAPLVCPAPSLWEPTYILAPDDGWSNVKKHFKRDLKASEELKAFLEENEKQLKLTIKEEKANAKSYPACLIPPTVCDLNKEVVNNLKVMNTAEDEECWQAEALPWVTCVSAKDGSTYPDLSCVEPSSDVGFRCLADYVWQSVYVYCVSNVKGDEVNDNIKDNVKDEANDNIKDNVKDEANDNNKDNVKDEVNVKSGVKIKSRIKIKNNVKDNGNSKGEDNVKVRKREVEPNGRFTTMQVRVAYACKAMIYKCQKR